MLAVKTEMPFEGAIEGAVAFVLIIAASSLIYMIGRRASPKTAQTGNTTSTYACGERAPVQKARITLTLSKYLIYFVILDSSVLLLAFATLIAQGVNTPLLLLYLGIMLASSLLLMGGDKD
jgi:NADH:ubiquinone oxidoreductase subunit 3 (subunit A)